MKPHPAPLPPRPVSFPEKLPISTRYPWGIRFPADYPLHVGLYTKESNRTDVGGRWPGGIKQDRTGRDKTRAIGSRMML